MAAESEALAGQNLKTAIAWRVARAEVLAARGEIDAAVSRSRRRRSRSRPGPTWSSTTPTRASCSPTCATRRATPPGRASARADAMRLYEPKGATVPAERLVGALAGLRRPVAQVAARRDPAVEAVATSPGRDADRRRRERRDPVPRTAPGGAQRRGLRDGRPAHGGRLRLRGPAFHRRDARRRGADERHPGRDRPGLRHPRARGDRSARRSGSASAGSSTAPPVVTRVRGSSSTRSMRAAGWPGRCSSTTTTSSRRWRSSIGRTTSARARRSSGCSARLAATPRPSTTTTWRGPATRSRPIS